MKLTAVQASAPQKILVIRLKAIGDVILATPVIRALRKAFPSSEIHFVTLPSAEPVLRHNPRLNQLIIYPKNNPTLAERARFFLGLNRAGYDWVIDLESTPRSFWVTLATRAPIRVGYDFRIRRWAFTHPVPQNKVRKYQGEICLDLVRLLGVPSDGPKTEIFLGPEEKAWADKYFALPVLAAQKWKIGLNPTGTWTAKQWPVEKWRELIQLLHGALGVKSLVFWGPGGEEMVQKITRGLEDQALPSPKAGLLEAASYVSKLDLLIGTDGTPQHMAQAQGVPSLTLFGPSWGIGYTPTNDPRHKFLQIFPDCGPCDHTVCPFPPERIPGSHYHKECLDRISPEIVLEAARKMLG